MISKELLSEVLGVEVTMVGITTGGLLYYRVIVEVDEYDGLGYATKEVPTSTNIYELAHKVKEWAFNEGYIVKSYKQKSNRYYSDIYTIDGTPLTTTASSDGVSHDLLTGQWILENKDV